MYPILLTIGDKTITSFGVFLVLSLVVALFTMWRIGRFYEIDGEKILDLFFLTLIGGFLFSRLYFVGMHYEIFTDFSRVVFLNRYPGISFWGGLIGGILTLWLLAKRFKFSFWYIADLAIVGLFIGIVLGSIGCFFGGCQYGKIADGFLAVPQAGVLEKRFPIQLVEAGLFFFGFLYLWKKVQRYNIPGTLAAKGLFILGIIKLLLEFNRGSINRIPFIDTPDGLLWGMTFTVAGTLVHYQLTKHTLWQDAKFIGSLFQSDVRRKQVLTKLRKGWYNHAINLKLKLQRLKKRFGKSLHLKPNPPKI